MFLPSFFPPSRSLSQVVECLLSLPVEYWSQFMFSNNNNQGRSDHMIIENSNVHATPDQKSIIFIVKHLKKKITEFRARSFFYNMLFLVL